MRVAVCFWGLTRSLKYTIHSIDKHILNILKKANIDYSIFMHTYTFKSTYYNPRASEVNVQLDFDEYKLFNPDFLQIDDQDTIRDSLDLHKYRTLPDPWDTNYICVDNFLLAMYSKMQLGKMLKHSK